MARPLGREEWGLVLDAAEPWIKPILRMAVATGARLKEIVGLTRAGQGGGFETKTGKYF